MARLKVKEVGEALQKKSGNMAAVARSFGVTRQAVWKYVQEHEGLKEVQKELRETFVDEVESGLYQNAISGHVTAQIFILKTLGKDRGYVERSEITGKDGKDLTFTLAINNADA